MKKITIIGANSSLARNFIFSMRNKGVHFVLYDMQDTYLDSLEYEYHKINFNDKASFDSIDVSGEALYVFSGLTGADKSNQNPNLFIDVNEKTLVSILEVMKSKNPNCRIMYPSSRLVYKDIEGTLKEDSPLEAKSMYALNKIFAENCIKMYHKLYGIPYTIFRIAIPFGELNRNSTSYGIVAKLKQQAHEGAITLFGDGKSVRTFTHIASICEALSYFDLKELENGIYNIGGVAYSFLDLATTIQRTIPCDIQFVAWPEEYEKVEVKNGHLDSSKLDSIVSISYHDILNELGE